MPSWSMTRASTRPQSSRRWCQSRPLRETLDGAMSAVAVYSPIITAIPCPILSAGHAGEARGVRPHRPHRPRQARPAHLHPDAVGQPVLAARLQPALGDGTDQRPPRPRLQLRDPLHPRPREDEDPRRAGAGGDDGHGARPGARRPRRANAFPGRRRAVSRHRLSPLPPPPSPIVRAGRRHRRTHDRRHAMCPRRSTPA